MLHSIPIPAERRSTSVEVEPVIVAQPTIDSPKGRMRMRWPQLAASCNVTSAYESAGQAIWGVLIYLRCHLQVLSR